MARSHKPKWYCEPWHPVKSTAWMAGFRNKPTHGDTPEQVIQVGLDWEASKLKAEQDADWFVRGSNMESTAVCTGLLGDVTVTDGGRLIMTARRLLGMPEDAPDHAALAKRACDAVNAVAGITDPVKLIADVRALLLDLSTGRCDVDDHRIVSCLGRMIPAEELVGVEE